MCASRRGLSQREGLQAKKSNNQPKEQGSVTRVKDKKKFCRREATGGGTEMGKGEQQEEAAEGGKKRGRRG